MATQRQMEAYREWLKRWELKDEHDNPERLLREAARNGLTVGQRLWLTMMLSGIACGGYAGEVQS